MMWDGMGCCGMGWNGRRVIIGGGDLEIGLGSGGKGRKRWQRFCQGDGTGWDGVRFG